MCARLGVCQATSNGHKFQAPSYQNANVLVCMFVRLSMCVSVYKSNVCFGDSTGHVFEFN